MFFFAQPRQAVKNQFPILVSREVIIREKVVIDFVPAKIFANPIDDFIHCAESHLAPLNVNYRTEGTLKGTTAAAI